MIEVKTELVVEYTTIINLQGVLRDLVAEYVVHTSRILIQPINWALSAWASVAWVE